MKKKVITTEAIEVTTFKLNGYTSVQFIKANKEVDAWLVKQPGFKSRRMYELGDGTIADMLIWDSVENGTQSMHRLLNERSVSRVHDMINQSTVSWSIDLVSHRVIYSETK